MQITALRENLATVRTDLKLAQEKLIQLDQLAVEKIGSFTDYFQFIIEIVYFLFCGQ